MKVKLTPAFVANAQPEPGADRTIYWDASERSFGLMVTARGHKSFVVQYRAGNQSRRMRLKDGLTLDKARREAVKIKGDVAKGHDPLAERRRVDIKAADTLASITEEYFDREGRRIRTMHERRTVLRRLVISKLGSRPIGDITRTDIVRLLDRIEDQNGAPMADHVLAYLRRVFNWHASRSDDFRSPIVRGMARTKPSQRRRQRVLTDEELRAVWRAAEAQGSAFASLVLFLLLTATRRTEAARMRRSELIGEDWIIPERRYKTSLELVIPLSPAARAVLDRVPQIGQSDFVFTLSGKRPIAWFSGFKSVFDRKVTEELRKHDPQAQPLPNWTLHDLRRTARSLMSRAGIPSDIAERCLGHVLPGVRGTYDRHAYHDEKRRAFEALAGLIERIVNPPADNVVALRAGL